MPNKTKKTFKKFTSKEDKIVTSNLSITEKAEALNRTIGSINARNWYIKNKLQPATKSVVKTVVTNKLVTLKANGVTLTVTDKANVVVMKNSIKITY